MRKGRHPIQPLTSSPAEQQLALCLRHLAQASYSLGIGDTGYARHHVGLATDCVVGVRLFEFERVSEIEARKRREGAD